MSGKTRFVLLTGCGILVAGLLAGGVAYLTSGDPATLVAQSNPDELRYVPVDAHVVAYANVRDVMRSGFRARLRDLETDGERRQRFREMTGIDLETDIDHIVVGLTPGARADDEPRGLALLVGRFDASRLEALARRHGGSVQQYQGRTLFTGVSSDGDDQVAMSFVETGVLALGGDEMVRLAIDTAVTGVPDVTTNDRVMGLIARVRDDHNAWAVADLDGLDTESLLAERIETRVPPLTAAVFGGRIADGVRTMLTVVARDAQAAADLRDVVRGFAALARMQASSHPGLAPLLDSIQLTGEGAEITVTFDVPSDVLDLIVSTRSPGALDEP